LNGVPVKFAAIPFLSTWGWSLTERDKRENIRDYLLLSKRMGATMQRHIYDPEYRAEMNDEEGIVMAQGFGGVVYPMRQIVESEEFWANAAKFDAELIKGLRNSPSIVTWYVSNEFMGASEPDNQRRLQELGRALAPLDPTRIFEFGCDLDLGGYAQIISTHYPVDIRALREERGVLPEAAYWHRFGVPLRPGDKAPKGLIRSVANVKGESPITWGQKPLVINETLWNFFFNPPDGFSRLVGDETYTGSVAAERAYQLTNDWFIRGHRDAEASVITPWEWISRNPLKRGIPAIDINPLQRYAHFYGGQTVDFDINLHHDRFQSSQLEFVWTLLQNGRTLQREAKTGTFESGALHREHLRLTLPKVTARTHCELVLQLTENGKELRRLTLPLDVYPRAAVSWPAGARFAVYDPQSTLAATLKTFSGAAPTALTRLDEASLRGVGVLLIGNDAAQNDDAEARAALKNFLNGGGRVLVLTQQKAPALLPVQLAPTQLVANRLWSFRSDHPVLRGLSAEDCSDWYPTQRTGANFYLKPESGNWSTLLESGGPAGMIYSGLLETRIGDGLLVCSQLDLTGHFDQNPMAALLWRNLLAYLAQKPEASTRAGVWGATDGPLRRGLEPLHAAVTPVASADDLRNFDVVLLDGADALSDADVAAINRFVQNGGRLMIHGVTPANRAAVSKLCGSAVRVLAPAPRAWSGRAIRTETSALSAGLTNYDLFWKRRPDTEDYAAIFVNESSTLAPLGDWVVEPAQGRTLLYPGFLAEVPLGRGRDLLDKVNWLQPGPLVRTNARRIASTLLTNLGVRLEAINRVAIPADLKYSPVDLSGVLNRSFVDEVADDGQGGWTDQGPNADLRSFPTEPAIQSFEGVPFRIEKGRSALVLASRFRPKGPPESVELPVSGRADALFFLQTSAWTSNRQHGSYIVHYADGSQYEIQLTGGVNLRDWAASNAGDAFPLETDTITRVAWSGKTKDFPSVNLYLMAWPNPHPERAVRSVTFQSLNQGVPILVGVTIGVRQAASTRATPQGQADAALAQKLISEGRAARQAGQAATAIERFKAAIAANSREATSYLELASVYESQKNWSEAVAAYQSLLGVKPDDLETLFRLGRAYEENGDWDKAEQTYRHSLEVNRNQPEILRALAELAQRRPKH
jgi:beta-galactosidase